MNQEGVDAGAPRRPERRFQDLARLVVIDVSHHVDGAVQIAVADRGDEDVADLAVIDAGNLLCGLWGHAERPCAMEGVAGLDQAPVVLRNASMQSESSSGVCTDI